MNVRKPIVLFGTSYVARFLLFMFRHDSPYEVVALTVDRQHLAEPLLFGLPVVPFEDLPSSHPPDRFAMFVALGYTHVNRLRAEKCRAAREQGYELVSHVSPRASTWPGLELGDNCYIMDQSIIHPFVSIADNVVAWSGVHIGHGSVIGDNVFLASRALVAGSVTVGPNCFIGANATIRHRVTLGRETVVGAGAVISKDTQERSIHAAPVPRVLPGTSDRLPGL